MKPFAYVKPPSEGLVVDASRAPSARIIAGGTNLVDLMRLGVETPDLLVDVNALPLGQIEESEGGLRIGALVRNTELAYDERVRQRYPALSQALLSGASAQVRNMASVAGNLLQRTRCAYFRDAGVSACNKRHPGSGCAAQEGYTRMHAILGGSEACIAAHPSDMCVALAAFDAVVHTGGAKTRAVPLVDFHVPPGDHPHIETVLEPGEIVTHVSLPATSYSARSVYLKARDCASFAFALASAAVALDLAGSTVRGARVALGGIATKPWRSHEAEQALVGGTVGRALFEKAAAAALVGARVRQDNTFKIKLAQRVLVRALEQTAALS
jgi:xanthine dehydrogenase YagS FAD-binding subunit